MSVGYSFIGHSARLSSASFSTDGSLVLGAGEGKAYIWHGARPEGPALTIDHWKPQRAGNSVKTPLDASPTFAKFFFVDRFTVLVRAVVECLLPVSVTVS